MPGFNNGDTAPHYVYDPRDRSWYVWAEFEDGYVGTMKGHSAGHFNCQAFQVEILAYSDRALAESVDGLWVGDMTVGHYDDLAAFYAWAMDRYGIGDQVTPTPAGGWLYGTSSPHRMSNAEWDAFTGLTAHGAVPNQTHWDTGILDLVLIAGAAGENRPPNAGEVSPWALEAWGKAWRCDLINKDTHPGDAMTKEEYFVFQDRAGFLDCG